MVSRVFLLAREVTDMCLESLGNTRSIVVLAVKSCSKAFLHLLRGMGKVHAFGLCFLKAVGVDVLVLVFDVVHGRVFLK